MENDDNSVDNSVNHRIRHSTRDGAYGRDISLLSLGFLVSVWAMLWVIPSAMAMPISDEDMIVEAALQETGGGQVISIEPSEDAFADGTHYTVKVLTEDGQVVIVVIAGDDQFE